MSRRSPIRWRPRGQNVSPSSPTIPRNIRAIISRRLPPCITAASWTLPAFSPCGTGIPVDRLGFLRHAEVVYGVLDGDDAGSAAAGRLGEQLGTRWRPLRLPAGLDLNDLGRRPDGRNEFGGLLAAAKSNSRLEAYRGNQ